MDKCSELEHEAHSLKKTSQDDLIDFVQQQKPSSQPRNDENSQLLNEQMDIFNMPHDGDENLFLREQPILIPLNAPLKIAIDDDDLVPKEQSVPIPLGASHEMLLDRKDSVSNQQTEPIHNDVVSGVIPFVSTVRSHILTTKMKNNL